MNIGDSLYELGEIGVFSRLKYTLIDGFKRFPSYKTIVQKHINEANYAHISVICDVEEDLNTSREAVNYLEDRLPKVFDVPPNKIFMVALVIRKKPDNKEKNYCHMYIHLDKF